jgi:hypothetical protein
MAAPSSPAAVVSLWTKVVLPTPESPRTMKCPGIPLRAASSKVLGWVAATQIGGCGFWIGFGQQFTNSAYGLVVNRLPPGTYDIAVFAYSTVAHRFANDVEPSGWVISVGKGFAFSASLRGTQ